MGEVITRLSDMNPRKKLHLEEIEDGLKLRIEWWENEGPWDRNHIQFCTHAWWWHSVNMVHASRKLFELLEDSDRFETKRIEINNQLLEVLKTFDSDVIFDFPLAGMEWKREITIPYDKISKEKKTAFEMLYKAAKKDKQEYPDNY